eukprot:348763_1
MNEVMNAVVHNYPVSKLDGWKCVYRKPYSHKTSTDELKGLCDEKIAHDVFVGGYHKDDEHNIILGAFAPSSVLHHITNSISEGIIPSDVLNKGTYNVYWYHYEKMSFGFSSSPKISLGNADNEETNREDRLSWKLAGDGGWSVGNEKGLYTSQEYYKVIFMKQRQKADDTTKKEQQSKSVGLSESDEKTIELVGQKIDEMRKEIVEMRKEMREEINALKQIILENNKNANNNNNYSHSDTKDIREFLEHKVNLPQYIHSFINGGFTDSNSFAYITNEDLKELGCKVAHRHKILNALRKEW